MISNVEENDSARVWVTGIGYSDDLRQIIPIVATTKRKLVEKVQARLILIRENYADHPVFGTEDLDREITDKTSLEDTINQYIEVTRKMQDAKIPISLPIGFMRLSAHFSRKLTVDQDHLHVGVIIHVKNKRLNIFVTDISPDKEIVRKETMKNVTNAWNHLRPEKMETCTHSLLECESEPEVIADMIRQMETCTADT